MPRFSVPLTTTQLASGLFRVEISFKYYYGEFPNERFVEVEKGFVSDLYSVPWPFSMLVPKSGIGNQAAVLHDKISKEQMFNKKTRDKMLLNAMMILNVPKWRRKLIHTGVKRFGRFYGA